MSWQWQGYAAGSGHGYDYTSSSSTTYKKTQFQPRLARDQHTEKLEIWLCKICDKEFGSKAGLNRHFTMMHEQHQPKQRAIKDVQRAMVPYRANAPQHSQSIVCGQCGKDFASQSNLTRHLNQFHQRAQGISLTKNTKLVQKTQNNVTINMYNPTFYNCNHNHH